MPNYSNNSGRSFESLDVRVKRYIHHISHAVHYRTPQKVTKSCKAHKKAGRQMFTAIKIYLLHAGCVTSCSLFENAHEFARARKPSTTDGAQEYWSRSGTNLVVLNEPALSAGATMGVSPSTKATVGVVNYPLLGKFFSARLCVTRASDPPCSLRSRVFALLFNIFDINAVRDGYLRCTKNKKPNVVLSVRCRVTRASGSDPDMKIRG